MTDLTSLKNIFNEHTETPLLCFIEAVSGVVDYELKYHLDAEDSSFAYEKDVFVFIRQMMELIWSAYRKNEKDTGESHNWFYREAERELHPVVINLLKTYGEYWFDVLMERPHISEDGQRLAYTRSVAHGIQDRQTVTSLGKYLAKTFAGVPDNVLRDEASLFVPDVFKIVNTTEEMIEGVNNGPYSCMAWGDRNPDKIHPYSCYTPDNGWSLALRIHKDEIVGRCLCHESKDNKIFVRSYKRHTSNNSPTDTALEAWLKKQGFSRKFSWGSDCQIKISHRRDGVDRQVFPYIDGENKKVDEEGFIVYEGRYKCNQTDGNSEDNDNDGEGDYIGECRHCSQDLYEDDDNHEWAGQDQEVLVCSACIQDRYSYVRGSSRREYYLRDENTIYCPRNGNNYDIEYIDEYGMVEIDGDAYDPDQDDICCIDGEWHQITDDIVSLAMEDPDTGDSYGFKDDCWQDHKTYDWYPSSIPYVEINGMKYHPESDFAVEYAEQLEEEEAKKATSPELANLYDKYAYVQQTSVELALTEQLSEV